MIPDSFIQDLLARVDIVDLVDAYVPLKKAGANYAACCPFHNEKSPSFTVSPTKQFYHCFGCGAHGTAIGFVMEYQGVGFIDAVKELASRAGMQVPESEGRSFKDEKPGQTRTLIDIMARAAQYYKDQLKASPRAVEYCKKRGLSGEIAGRFGMGYAPDGWQNLQAVFPDYNAEELKLAGLVIENEAGRRYDRFRDRLMIPIINPKGDIIAFGGRIIDQGEPKYLNSPETPLFEKGRELFGLPQARQALRETDTAIVTEGYMDVIALAQNGVGNAVATLGTATTATHVNKLLRQVDRVVFCFDGDNAGRKAAWRALENSLEALADNKRLGFVFLPQDEDPDSYIRTNGKAEFDRLVLQAMPLSDFLLRELAQRCDLTSSEGKAQLIYEAKPLLLKLPTPLLRLQLVKRLAEASGFAQSEVERLCELKSFTPAAPPKSRRTAPSLTRNLLRIVLHMPQLAGKLPIDLLPDTPERAPLLRLHQLVSANGETSSYAGLREQLRGLPEEQMIENAAAELLGQHFDEAEAEEEFRDTLEKLQEGGQKRAFAELQAKAQQFGVAGLSAAEKQTYIQLLSGKQNRS
ncbi:DNA primase [Dechloromonas denitrificans]|uniref:DNA primase n=1 Tax=Dechloromonas denitrificans TaxID=281362 RepID=UPI001CF80797|nr:DNA primase [Dechloromonas denitrificans]UCV04308.1 DNA primase [Dechloromonas denitrificans]UCV08635.1 DNA primase [Dechloromonas denitrificans]